MCEQGAAGALPIKLVAFLGSDFNLCPEGCGSIPTTLANTMEHRSVI